MSLPIITSVKDEHVTIYKSMLNDIVDHAFNGCGECTRLVSHTIFLAHFDALVKDQ